MRTKFDEQLRQLGMKMTHMGNLIEKNIQDAVQALLSQDTETARRIMAEDELVDQEQKKIENICFQLLIQQQPVARDLRTITAALKMVTDMERIGRQSADIADIVSAGAISGDEDLGAIHAMALSAANMVTDSIDAFVKSDEALARSVIAQDDIVDRAFDTIKESLIRRLGENRTDGESALDLLMIAKYLERLGDHAVNIAHWVIYSITGTLESE